MNPVLEWLRQHDGYSFDEGVAILLRYNSNRGVNQMIISRRDRRHLGNELSRLAHIPNLRPLPGMEEPKGESTGENSPQSPEVPKNKEPKETVDTQEKTDNSEGEGDNHVTDESSEAKGESEGEYTISFLDLKRHEREDPAKLPPQLKELWEKNRDEYKELQFCHAQMKQANSDAGRADWRRQLFEHRKSIQERWKLFDEEKARLAEEKPEEKAYNPFNDRSNISKALKDPNWSDEKKLKVQRWVDALRSHNVTIKEETLKRLKERGISV